MYILIFMIVGIALGFFFLKQLDQRRWQRYQIERDVYFRQHPYSFKTTGSYSIAVAMNKSAQFKLINELMLKSSQQPVQRAALIQRMPAQSHHRYIIKVLVEDITIGYLDQSYAERFCLSLEDTDFFIGRPISTQAEISFYALKPNILGCRLKLDLPNHPHLASHYLMHLSDPHDAKTD
ncbi:hypothetical protein [Acinetobacter lanii]|uniref:Uncharacterized protein n=1 Tax=Acinetobacter lanii TaxID=2715163 RepID=A0A6G8S0I0_9GAMM|nr:hypothetical protein [Acinetobacter lanii]QIO07699.1 hypothetical protein G8D99_00745 [Acinetobacter lanii]